MDKKYDMHLSAGSIGPETIRLIKVLGFKEDFFRNNRNSQPPHYHASYHEHLNKPNDELWKVTTYLLQNDPGFRGCLEEEEFSDEFRFRFAAPQVAKFKFTPKCQITPFELEICKPGEHKACDIHINIDLGLTSPAALELMEEFNFISFERRVDGSERRIYSLTFKDLSAGVNTYCWLMKTISFGFIPGLVGKMKLEEVTRFMAHPLDAEQLPIVRTSSLANRDGLMKIGEL